MSDEPPPASANRELTAEIVAAYVRRNQIGTEQLGTLISTVHQVLADLGKPASEAVVERTPAVDPAIGSARQGDLPRMRLGRQHAPTPSWDRPWADG
jgi:hypothetical protein